MYFHSLPSLLFAQTISTPHNVGKPHDESDDGEQKKRVSKPDDESDDGSEKPREQQQDTKGTCSSGLGFFVFQGQLHAK